MQLLRGATSSTSDAPGRAIRRRPRGPQLSDLCHRDRPRLPERPHIGPRCHPPPRGPVPPQPSPPCPGCGRWRRRSWHPLPHLRRHLRLRPRAPQRRWSLQAGVDRWRPAVHRHTQPPAQLLPPITKAKVQGTLPLHHRRGDPKESLAATIYATAELSEEEHCLNCFHSESILRWRQGLGQ